MLTILGLTSLILAAVPAWLFLENLREYREPRPAPLSGFSPSISVLIPARDEEASIAGSVESALLNRGVDLELIVLDDHSCDATAAIVRTIAERDPRVRLVPAPDLPEGWCGKQHACATLAALASRPILVFLDADVRLASDALARMADFLEESGADLVSGFPRQETVGIVEKMVIPLMHFVLLGFLPVRRMRIDGSPCFAAGCGQLFATTKSTYEQMGGHAAIRSTLHDGLKLPRAYRALGLKTDLFDATNLATCRMYRTASDVWFGLAKNATEALAAPTMIVPATLLLFIGQVAPIVLVALGIALGLSAAEQSVAAVALTVSYLPRALAVVRFRQSVLGAVLHPLGVLTLLAIQWYALGREVLGRPSTWKGRFYPARSA